MRVKEPSTNDTTEIQVLLVDCGVVKTVCMKDMMEIHPDFTVKYTKYTLQTIVAYYYCNNNNNDK